MYQNSRLRQPVAKKSRRTWPLFAVILVIAVAALAAFFLLPGRSNQQNSIKSTKTAPAFDKQRYSLSDPASPWVVVNKQRPLSPLDYAPASLKAPTMRLAGQPTDESMQLSAEAADALTALDQAARAASINLLVVSAYRSYQSQQVIYNSEVKGFGQTVADTESARPGHSEHQTGWAVDLGAVNRKCEVQDCFAATPEGKWLAANAHAYGFILRYIPGKTAITGYKPEPWHLRYIGRDLSTQMHTQKTQTLEEFFNLPAAPAY